MDEDTTVPVFRKRVWMMICTVIAVLLIVGAAWRLLAMQKQKQNLPPAPVGFKWVRLDALSDEFTGRALDAGKWRPFHPYWEGRIPSQFNPDNVTVADGMLQLTNVALIESMDDVADAAKDVWVHAACVSSLEPIVRYGYYEARFKAANLSMTSSFWMQGQYSEIDVVEQIGNPRNQPSKAKYMLMNTHYYPDGWDNDVKTPEYAVMSSGSAEEFHTYGVWWKDAHTIWMYLDGEKVAELTTGGPFDEPMTMFFDTEIFVWEGLPSLDALNDPEARVMHVDWVRSWQLAEK